MGADPFDVPELRMEVRDANSYLYFLFVLVPAELRMEVWPPPPLMSLNHEA